MPAPIVGVVVAARPITLFTGLKSPVCVDVIWRVFTRCGIFLLVIFRYVAPALRDFVPRAVALFVVVARVFVVVRICCKFADVRPSPLAMPMNIKHDNSKKRITFLVILT